MGQRGAKPKENLGNRTSELPRLPKQPPVELGDNEYARAAYKRFVPVLESLGHV